MTAADFRTLALELPEAAQSAHMGHADFRVRGKIFATLAPDESWGMVKLDPEQQRLFVRTEPAVFQPIKGQAWLHAGEPGGGGRTVGAPSDHRGLAQHRPEAACAAICRLTSRRPTPTSSHTVAVVQCG
jgi:hypothetical protein